MAKGATPALLALEHAGIAYILHAYHHDPDAPSFGLEAAAALDRDPREVFKTLIATVDGKLAVAIVPVTGRLNLKAFASALHRKKADMALPADAERATGYVIGGISPVGQRKRLPTVLDSSALAFQQIYISAGRRGLQLAVAPTDLIALTHARTAALTE